MKSTPSTLVVVSEVPGGCGACVDMARCPEGLSAPYYDSLIPKLNPRGGKREEAMPWTQAARPRTASVARVGRLGLGSAEFV